jgi:hypothetical protein
MKTPLKISVLIAASLLVIGRLAGAPVTFTASLSGPAESPPVASPGTGFATVMYDATAHTLGIELSFSDLLGTTTASHIHAPTAEPFLGTAGVATQVPTFVGFPLGVSAGSYSQEFDLTLLSSFNPAYVTANGGTAASAEAALAAAMFDGKSYLNIHTTAFRSGEIRGFLARVPDSTATLVLLLPALAALAGLRRYGRIVR